MPQSKTDPEPRPLAELQPFEVGDFHCLSEGLDRDPQYNDRRLVVRRKLGTIAKQALGRMKADGAPAFNSRTSLHNPHAFNGMRVRRIWAYICRAKPEKTRLRRVLGAELAKDLDAAYRNAYLCVAVESEALEVSLRIHPDAWFDGQNLVNRVEREGVDGWLDRLNALSGYRLRLDNWKGEWRCGELNRDSLGEFLRYYKPGELGLAVERRWPVGAATRELVCAPGVPEELVRELEALVPLYRYTAWSEESSFLFGS